MFSFAACLTGTCGSLCLLFYWFLLNNSYIQGHSSSPFSRNSHMQRKHNFFQIFKCTLCERKAESGQESMFERSCEKLLTFLRHIQLLTNVTQLEFSQDGGTLFAFFARLSDKIARFKPTINRNCYQKLT